MLEIGVRAEEGIGIRAAPKVVVNTKQISRYDDTKSTKEISRILKLNNSGEVVCLKLPVCRK